VKGRIANQVIISEKKGRPKAKKKDQVTPAIERREIYKKNLI